MFLFPFGAPRVAFRWFASQWIVQTVAAGLAFSAIAAAGDSRAFSTVTDQQGTSSESPAQAGPGELIKTADDPTIYWLQSNVRYQISSPNVIPAMSGMPGWSGPTRTLSGSGLPVAIGPAFIDPTSGSNGLLVRRRNTTTVYLVQNGRLRPFVSDEATFNWTPQSGSVIEVAESIVNRPYTSGIGQEIYGIGEGESDAVVKQAFKDAYARLVSTCGTRGWAGWSGRVASCLELPQTKVLATAPSSMSSISGKAQSFGNESTRLGAIVYNGSKAVGIWGAIYRTWQALSYSSGPLGLPTSDEYDGDDSRRSDFEGGHISWSPATNKTTIEYSEAARGRRRQGR